MLEPLVIIINCRQTDRQTIKSHHSAYDGRSRELCLLVPTTSNGDDNETNNKYKKDKTPWIIYF